MKFTKFEQFNEALVSGGNPTERSIDLRGESGNAYVILGMAKNLCSQLKNADPERYDWDKINKEMTSGDYKNLVNTFEEYFGDYVTIYNADVLEESTTNEEFKNPFKKKEVQIEPNLPVEEFTAPETKKIKPEEGYDLERFYNAIEELDNREQKSRKHEMSMTFFRDFIGKELLNSTIEKILVDARVEMDHYGMNIELKNGSKIYYNFSKNGDNPYDYISIEPKLDFTNIGKEIAKDSNIPTNQQGQLIQRRKEELKKDAKKVSRKDARLISQIAKKFNPDTKYKNGTGDLVIKEYESRIIKFNDFLNENN